MKHIALPFPLLRRERQKFEEPFANATDLQGPWTSQAVVRKRNTPNDSRR